MIQVQFMDNVVQSQTCQPYYTTTERIIGYLEDVTC